MISESVNISEYKIQVVSDMESFVPFSKGIVQALEYPAHVLVAFNKDTKVMGIQVCRAKTRGAFSFCKTCRGEKRYRSGRS